MNVARNETLNIYATHLQKQIPLARRREWDEMKEGDTQFRVKADNFHFSNRVGWQLLSLVMLNVGLVFKNAYLAEAKDALFLELVGKRLAFVRSDFIDINVRNLPIEVDTIIE